MEDRPSSRRELFAAIGIAADIEPVAAIRLVLRTIIRAAFLGVRGWAVVFLDVLIATRKTANYAVRPAHFLDVLKALFVGSELLICFPNVHGSRLTQI